MTDGFLDTEIWHIGEANTGGWVSIEDLDVSKTIKEHEAPSPQNKLRPRSILADWEITQDSG